MKKTKSVATYISGSKRWRDELTRLRSILRKTGLEETVKWGAPCYTHKGKNVVGMAAFNDYFGLWFHQGALLKDTNNKLMNAQEGKTKALRQWRMTSASDIKPMIISRYVKESIANVDKGNEIKPAKAKSAKLPEELLQALKVSTRLQKAFDTLTPGRQREYGEYIAEAKRAPTKERRLEKIKPMILKGHGLNDRYK